MCIKPCGVELGATRGRTSKRGACRVQRRGQLVYRIKHTNCIQCRRRRAAPTLLRQPEDRALGATGISCAVVIRAAAECMPPGL